MTRQSTDERGPDGRLMNGFDYDLQVWVRDGIVQPCAHPASMACGCKARRYAGLILTDVRAVHGLEQVGAFKCPLCGQVITDGKPCGCGAR